MERLNKIQLGKIKQPGLFLGKVTKHFFQAKLIWHGGVGVDFVGLKRTVVFLGNLFFAGVACDI